MRSLSLRYGFVAVLCSLGACADEKPAVLDVTHTSACLGGVQVNIPVAQASDSWPIFEKFYQAAVANTDNEAILNTFTEADGSRESIADQIKSIDKYQHYGKTNHKGYGTEIVLWDNYQIRDVAIEFNGKVYERPAASYCETTTNCKLSQLTEKSEFTILRELMEIRSDTDCANDGAHKVLIYPNAYEAPSVDAENPLEVRIDSTVLKEHTDNSWLQSFLEHCAKFGPNGVEGETGACSYEDVPSMLELEGKAVKSVSYNELALYGTLADVELQKVYHVDLGSKRFLLAHATREFNNQQYIIRANYSDNGEIMVDYPNMEPDDLLFARPEVIHYLFGE